MASPQKGIKHKTTHASAEMNDEEVSEESNSSVKRFKGTTADRAPQDIDDAEREALASMDVNDTDAKEEAPKEAKVTGGLPFSMFQLPRDGLKELREWAECLSCRRVVRTARALQCCHKLLCQSCAEVVWSRRPDVCMNPECDAAVSKSKGLGSYAPALPWVDHRLREHEVVCIHQESRGCKDWSGLLKELPEHLEECPFEDITCKCGVVILRGDSVKHQDTCGCVAIECEYCHGSVERKDYILHCTMCPEFPINCPNACGSKDLARKDLEEHRRECPQEPVTCEWICGDSVCDWKGTRKDREAHVLSSRDKHSQLVVTELKRVEEMKARIEELREKITEMEDGDVFAVTPEERLLTKHVEALDEFAQRQEIRRALTLNPLRLTFQASDWTEVDASVSNKGRTCFESKEFFVDRVGFKMKCYPTGNKPMHKKFVSLFMETSSPPIVKSMDFIMTYTVTIATKEQKHEKKRRHAFNGNLAYGWKEFCPALTKGSFPHKVTVSIDMILESAHVSYAYMGATLDQELSEASL